MIQNHGIEYCRCWGLTGHAWFKIGNQPLRSDSEVERPTKKLKTVSVLKKNTQTLHDSPTRSEQNKNTDDNRT